MKRLLALVAVVGLAVAPTTLAKSGSGGHAHGSSSSHKAKTGSSSTKEKSDSKPKSVHAEEHTKNGAHAKAHDRCETCPRDKHGRIVRSAKARDDFMRQTGFPKGRKGYVVDHRVPLECGGSDTPANMQWQTVAEAKAKDKTEARCR